MKHSAGQSSQTAAQSLSLQALGSRPADARPASPLLRPSTSFLSPSLSSAVGPGALSRSDTQRQVTPTKQASRQHLAPRGANQHRSPPLSTLLRRANNARSTGVRARPPRESAHCECAGPRGTTSPVCALGGRRRGRGPA
ncbi:hypothetical protein NDU88_001806 [Pleurodeles waltl]|uniref:Uncharacterized protein n=1 Tax=Pleurodeles waltl TaxID=8319 RepID=A0AAV7T135_PLEWA|nr:hypothetical protein NDU88_001806 [Pleurodeles waltl]